MYTINLGRLSEQMGRIYGRCFTLKPASQYCIFKLPKTLAGDPISISIEIACPAIKSRLSRGLRTKLIAILAAQHRFFNRITRRYRNCDQ